MALWLFKEEPETYCFADLERDGTTTWSGVKNAVAQKHLRAVQKGDRIFFYATGKVKSVVGVMEATANAVADPADAAGKLFVVTVKPVKTLKTPVTLATIKADKTFANWELVRLARLSVMPVPEELWKAIETLAK